MKLTTESKMKSMNGTAISSKDIIAIIKQCSESRVSEIIIGDINIKFDFREIRYENSTNTNIHNYQESDVYGAKTHEDELEENKIERATNDLLMFQDPVAWEESILREG